MLGIRKNWLQIWITNLKASSLALGACVFQLLNSHLSSYLFLNAGYMFLQNVHRGTILIMRLLTNDNLLLSEQGFVELRSVQDRNVSAQLHQNVELRVEIEAYPPPRVCWTKDDATVNGDNVVITKQEHETR